MPVSPTFPGVYIDEVKSAVHTITGVPTSIAALRIRTVDGHLIIDSPPGHGTTVRAELPCG